MKSDWSAFMEQVMNDYLYSKEDDLPKGIIEIGRINNSISNPKEGLTMKHTFLGLTMAQEWQDFTIWEEFFKSFPVHTFIELGTGGAGFSLYLALQCLHRGIKFHTFDNQKYFDLSTGMLGHLVNQGAFRFYFGDIFKELKPILVDLIATQPKPLAIFMDNGLKPLEWATYAPLTASGDYCIVHDWGTEFLPENMGTIPVVPILKELSDARGPGWKAAWFRRV